MLPGPGGSRRTSTPARSLAPPTGAAARPPHPHSPARAGAAILALTPRTPPPTHPGAAAAAAAAARSGGYVIRDAAAGPAPRARSAAVETEAAPRRGSSGPAEDSWPEGHQRPGVNPLQLGGGDGLFGAPAALRRCGGVLPAAAFAPHLSVTAGAAELVRRRIFHRRRPSFGVTHSASDGRDAGQFRYLQNLPELTGVGILRQTFPSRGGT